MILSFAVPGKVEEVPAFVSDNTPLDNKSREEVRFLENQFLGIEQAEVKVKQNNLPGFLSHIKQVNLNGSHLSLKTLTPRELHKLIEALKSRIEYEKQLLENTVPF